MNRNELEAIVFTKVGKHGIEPFQNILKRKVYEEKQTGKVWWGYNLKIRPELFVEFLRETKKRNIDTIQVVMYPCRNESPPRISSDEIQNVPENFEDQIKVIKPWAKRYKERKTSAWKNLPLGVFIGDSGRALVFSNFKDSNLSLDLGKYLVFTEIRGSNPHFEGTVADYDKGKHGYQTDTVCAILNNSLRSNKRMSAVLYQGTMIEPWCVYIDAVGMRDMSRKNGTQHCLDEY